MNRFIFFAIIFISVNTVFGQDTDTPRQISPKDLDKINTDIKPKVEALKVTLINQGFSKDEIEFAVDTFRAEQVVAKRMDIDYSTVGMNITIGKLTDCYDSLMNKYYNKLIKKLKPEDQKILITAQKAWLAFRDGEGKLYWAMTKDEYSGGGTMQSNIATGEYCGLVKDRTIAIFNYYLYIIREK